MNRMNGPAVPDNLFKYLMPLIYPIIIFGQVGGIAALVWLIVIGAWKIIISCFFITIILGFLLPYFLIPSALILSGAIASNKATHSKVFKATIFSSVYTTLITSISCLLVLHGLIGLTNEETITPTLILSYGTALFPFMRMTAEETKNGDATGSMYYTFFIQIAFIIAIVSYYFGIDLMKVNFLFVIVLALLSLTYTMVSQNQSGLIVNSKVKSSKWPRLH